MPREIKLNNNDLLIMNLVHYFITEKNYNPVILRGINDEIWLENLDSDYKLIRIVSHYIHNKEQLNFDRFKLKRILGSLKKKTFSLKMPVISIYTNLGEDVELPNEDNSILSLFVSKVSEIKNDNLIELFPDIVEKTNHEEKGIDLFVKISDDINKESLEKSKKVEKIFSMKKPFITYIIMFIFIGVFLTMKLLSRNISNNIFIDIFLHTGIIHLICNTYVLYVIGPQTESFYGKLKYLLIIIISGISGCLLAGAFTSNNLIGSGVNGIIFGLLGSIFYFGYHYRVYLGNVLKSQIIPLMGISILTSLFLSDIKISAYIGGIIGGVFASMAAGVPDKSSTSDKVNGYVLLTIYITFLIYLVFFR